MKYVFNIMLVFSCAVFSLVHASNTEDISFITITNSAHESIDLLDYFATSTLQSFNVTSTHILSDESVIITKNIDAFVASDYYISTTSIYYLSDTRYVEETTTSTESSVEVEDLGDPTRLQISEFIPNPEGSDDFEFIEIYNPTTKPIHLEGVALDDTEGGSKPYVFPEGFVIDAKSYRAFGRDRTGVVLNNSEDSVRIIVNDEVVDSVEYEEVFEGMSYILYEDEWYWTKHITPEAENILEVEDGVEEVVENEESDTKDKDTSKQNDVVIVPISEIENLEVDTKVETTGTVSVLPGVLGSQYFYIHDSAETGIQVYMYKKDFPDLKIGDVVKVVGVLSESRGEKRIKLSVKEDIVIIERGSDIPVETSTIEDVQTQSDTIDIVEIKGEITALKSHYIYVDDGTDEIEVEIKETSGLEKSQFKEGEIVSVQGIVSQGENGMSVVPMQKKNIKIEEKNVTVDDTDSADVAQVVFESQKPGHNYAMYVFVSSVVGAGVYFFPKYKNIILKKLEMNR